MRRVKSYLVIVVCLLLIKVLAQAQPENLADSGARLIDLTHPFDAATIDWPTAD